MVSDPLQITKAQDQSQVLNNLFIVLFVDPLPCPPATLPSLPISSLLSSNFSKDKKNELAGFIGQVLLVPPSLLATKAWPPPPPLIPVFTLRHSTLH